MFINGGTLMKSLLLPFAALIGLASTQTQAGFWKQMRKSMRVQVAAPVVYHPVAPCYSCHASYAPVVYRPMVYQPVVYRPVVRRPHVGFSFGTHGAGFSFWS